MLDFLFYACGKNTLQLRFLFRGKQFAPATLQGSLNGKRHGAENGVPCRLKIVVRLCFCNRQRQNRRFIPSFQNRPLGISQQEKITTLLFLIQNRSTPCGHCHAAAKPQPFPLCANPRKHTIAAPLHTLRQKGIQINPLRDRHLLGGIFIKIPEEQTCLAVLLHGLFHASRRRIRRQKHHLLRNRLTALQLPQKGIQPCAVPQKAFPQDNGFQLPQIRLTRGVGIHLRDRPRKGFTLCGINFCLARFDIRRRKGEVTAVFRRIYPKGDNKCPILRVLFIPAAGQKKGDCQRQQNKFFIHPFSLPSCQARATKPAVPPDTPDSAKAKRQAADAVPP